MTRRGISIYRVILVLSKRGKYMRKFILVIISMVSIFLTGCVSDPETYYFDAADLIANTIKIELVECKNEKLEMKNRSLLRMILPNGIFNFSVSIFNWNIL